MISHTLRHGGFLRDFSEGVIGKKSVRGRHGLKYFPLENIRYRIGDFLKKKCLV